MTELTNPASPPTPRKPIQWSSIGMLLLGVLGMLTLLGGAASGLLGGMFALFTPGGNNADVLPLLSYAAAGFFLCLLLVPSIVLSVRRLSGQDVTELPRFFARIVEILHPRRLIFLYPFVIAIGYWLIRYPAINWLVMPVLNIVALALPAAWLLWMGTRSFEPRTAHRTWGAFSLGMTLGPTVIIFLELVAIVVGIIIFAVGVGVFAPAIGEDLQHMLNSLQEGGLTGVDPNQAFNELALHPVVIGGLLLMISGFVPVVEEVLKPVAVWLLWNRPLTTQDGWTLGLLSGAGFAVLENFGNAQVGEGWAFIALARGGATALHMFNTGLIGYTFVLARRKKRYWLPVLALAAAILIHASWNAMTVFATLDLLKQQTDSVIWAVGFVVALAVVSLSLIAGIILINRQLAEPETDAPDMPASLAVETPPENFESEQS